MSHQHTTKQIFNLIFGLLLLVLAACSSLKSTDGPIEHVYFVKQDSSDVVIFLLPGIGGWLGGFSNYGVVDALARCQPTADIIGVDAHYEYYKDRNIHLRLHQDLVAPAKSQGKQVWLLGSSLGGFGALIYNAYYPESTDFIGLMAPYVGKKSDLETFVGNDEQQLKKLDNDLRHLWEFYDSSNSSLEKIHLGFGVKDRFRFQQQWLASKLPTSQVHTTEGRHRWPIWAQLWPELIANSSACSTDISR